MVDLPRITVPLMGKGLIAGGALVFLTAMKELPATLLLRPTGFETLSVRILAAASESLCTRASAAALVLLLVSAVPVYLHHPASQWLRVLLRTVGVRPAGDPRPWAGQGVRGYGGARWFFGRRLAG